MSIKQALVILIVIIVLSSCTNKLHKAIIQVQRQSSEMVVVDSLFTAFSNKYKLVVGYTSRKESGHYSGQFFSILCFDKDSAIAYKFERPFVITATTKRLTVDSFLVSGKIRDTILNKIYLSDNWNFNYDDSKDDAANLYFIAKDVSNQCFILHGLTYNLVMITKKSVTSSKLYAPDRYESECCSGNIDRIKFLEIKSLIDAVIVSGHRFGENM